MRVIKTAVILLGLTSWALSGYGAASLPFTANFDDLEVDDPLVAGGGWSFNIAPTGVSGTPDGSTRAIHSADNLTLSIGAGTSKVWWFSYAKVRAHSEPPLIGDDAAAFYVNTDGQLMAYSNNVFVSVASGVPTNTWLRFAVRLDYDTDAWDLYMANPHTAALQKRNGNPLPFQTGFAGNQITAAEISGETYLDAVSVEATIVPIDPGTPSPAYVTTTPPLLLEGAGTGVSLQYFGTSGELYGKLGLVLEGLFSTGDKLHFWDSVGGNFDVRTLEAAGWDGDFEIKPTTGFFVERVGEPKPSTALVAYDTVSSHTAAGDTAIVAGWNLLTVPHTAGARSLSSIGLPVAANDQVFLWTSSGWSISRYNGSSWTTNLTLPAGRTFWLRHRGAGGNWPALN